MLMTLKMNRDKIQKRWGRVITDNLLVERIEIENNEGFITNCYLYSSADFIGYEKMPGVIVFPRRDKRYPYFEHWGAHFALQGYPTICIQLYDKNLPVDIFLKKYQNVLQQVKKLLYQEERVNHEELIYFGIDLGGKLALLDGLMDRNVKLICGISIPLISENEIMDLKNSDKVYLIHCKDDNDVPFSYFETNKKILGLTNENILTFNRGGHYLLSVEHSAATFFSIKIKQALKPIFKQIIAKN